MFGTVFFACSCFFLMWVVLAGTPLQRINRACQPAEWVGRFAVTTGAAVSDKTEAQVRSGANTLFDTCRFFVFRQFYAEELRAQRAAAQQAAKGAAE